MRPSPSAVPADRGAGPSFARSRTRALSWTAPPERGESLLGFLTRVLASNWYPRTAAGLEVAGIRTLYPEAVAFADADAASRLAVLLAVDPAVVGAMAWRRLPGGRAERDGLVVPEAVATPRVRRLSPSTLRREPWHHAAWDVGALSFCPASLDELLTECPDCGGTFTWRRSVGPCHCDRCLDGNGRPTLDLRDCFGRRVESDDPTALAFAAGLLSPSPADRARSAERIPLALRGLGGPGSADLVVRLSTFAQHGTFALRSQIVGPDGTRRGGPLQAEAVAIAGRAMIEWPDGVGRVLAGTGTARVVLARRGTAEQTLRQALSNPTIDPDVASVLREAVAGRTAQGRRRERAEIRADARLTGATQASREIRITRRALRGLGFDGHLSMTEPSRTSGMRAFDRAELTELQAKIRDTTSAHAVARRLGLLPLDVRNLERAGLLARCPDIVSAYRWRGADYSAEGVARLERRIRDASRVLDGKTVSLACAALELPGRIVPWAGLVRLLLDGNVPFATEEDERRLAVAIRISASLDLAALPLERPRPPTDETVMTHAEIARLLLIRALHVMPLRKLGLLPEREVTWQDLLAFLDRRVSLREIVRRSDLGAGNAKGILADAGIHPTIEQDMPDGRELVVYARAEVEGLLMPWDEDGKQGPFVGKAGDPGSARIRSVRFDALPSRLGQI